MRITEEKLRVLVRSLINETSRFGIRDRVVPTTERQMPDRVEADEERVNQGVASGRPATVAEFGERVLVFIARKFPDKEIFVSAAARGEQPDWAIFVAFLEEVDQTPARSRPFEEPAAPRRSANPEYVAKAPPYETLVAAGNFACQTAKPDYFSVHHNPAWDIAFPREDHERKEGSQRGMGVALVRGGPDGETRWSNSTELRGGMCLIARYDPKLRADSSAPKKFP